ncbi:hypothetical protein [Thalassotalea agariperforans]
MNLLESKTVIMVTLMTLIGGIIGSFITSTYQAAESKRIINNEVIKLVAEKVLDGRPVMLKDGAGEDNLNKVFQYKENAFLVRQMTRYISDNYQDINFKALNSALVSLERRYSYAQIYKYNGLAAIICESLTLRDNQDELNPDQITISGNAKCPNQNMEGVTISLIKMDLANHRAKLKFENDNQNIICREKEFCEFWLDVGDRLESTPYKTLVLIEYIGMNDPYNEQNPMLSFSIVRRND